jgi:glucose/arabinose dehydrogenase
MFRRRMITSLVAVLALAACEDAGPDKPTAVGASPDLPKPAQSWIPTVDIAPAKGWAEGKTPVAAQGLTVNAFASGLDHPRWLYVLPNGDVLVAESNKPKTAGGKFGIEGWIMGLVMKRAGAGVESANRITLLRDADADGIAELKTPFATGLNSPFGMALVGGTLYVANADAVVAFDYNDGDTEMKGPPRKVVDLPAGMNHHWTKNIIASRDGTKLYATVGSNSNVGENGMDKEDNRAAILEIDPAAGTSRLFASGLRNPNGLGWEPQSGTLWTAVNERDELGNDLVPDYITSVKEGAFYGWPYSYFGQHVDTRVQPQRPDLVAKAVVPDYALGAHVAALGLTFAEGNKLPPAYASGAFVGLHGSWNRTPLSGYKVAFVPFTNGKPSGEMQDVLTGFVNSDGEAQGRPVGVAIAKSGDLLTADDVGNVVWRVSAGTGPAAAAR